MAKTLNELANELKAYIIELQSDAHNKGNLRPERYNNTKLTMDLAYDPTPHVIISIGMSSAEFQLKTFEKVNGGLGPDERYVLRWIDKPVVIENLRACWAQAERNRGRITDKNVNK